jgi:hypothetical protein
MSLSAGFSRHDMVRIHNRVAAIHPAAFSIQHEKRFLGKAQ